MRIVARVLCSEHYLVGGRMSNGMRTFDKVLKTETFILNEIYETT